MKSQSLIIAAVLAASGAGSAVAADLARPAPPPAPAPVYSKAAPVILYSWTGCYIGIEGGGAWGSSKQISGGPISPPGLSISDSYTASGALAGGTLGCNYQMSSWVFGLEGDFSWANKKGSANEIAPFTTTDTVGTEERWIGTVRGRLGFTPTERLLVYVTGGFADASVQADLTAAAGNFSDKHDRTGWTVGGGVEGAVWDNWSWKIEYLYVKFSSQEYFNPSPIPAHINIRSDVPLDNNIVRAGLNYRFGWGGR